MTQVIKEIKRGIRFVQTPLLQGRSPAELIYNFVPNTRFNRVYIQQGSRKSNLHYNNTELPRVGDNVWYKNAQYKSPNFIQGRVLRQKGSRLIDVEKTAERERYICIKKRQKETTD